MISKNSIRIKITLSKALYLACRKHHIRISKIAREVTEDALQEKLDRLNKKVNRQNRVNNERRSDMRELSVKDVIEKAIRWIECNANNGGVIYDGWKEDFRKEMIENEEL